MLYIVTVINRYLLIINIFYQGKEHDILYKYDLAAEINKIRLKKNII